MSDSCSFSEFDPISYSNDPKNAGFDPATFALDGIFNDNEDPQNEKMPLEFDDDTSSNKLNKDSLVLHAIPYLEIEMQRGVYINSDASIFERNIGPSRVYYPFLKYVSELGSPKTNLEIWFKEKAAGLIKMNDPKKVEPNFLKEIEFALLSKPSPLESMLLNEAISSYNNDNEEENISQKLTEIYTKISELSRCEENYKVETQKSASETLAVDVSVQMSQKIFGLIQKYLELEEKSSPKPPSKVNSDTKPIENKRMYSAPSKYKQKNFPKKIGDQFCDYINKMFGIKTNKILKDKTSWKLLNSFLSGSSKIAKNIDHKTFTSCFLQFIANYKADDIHKDSKTVENISNICHTINTMTLSLCCREILNRVQNGESYRHILIRKSWPKAVIEVYY